MRKLIDQRYPVYAHADMTVVSRELPHDMMVDEVLRSLTSFFQVEKSQNDG